MTPPETASPVPAARMAAAALALIAIAAAAFSALCQSLPRGGPPQIAGYERWLPETSALAETLPVQDGGRVKPLSAQAGFTLYALHGSRTLRIKDALGGRLSLSPTEWLLDTLFRPDLAILQPVFRVDNSEVIATLGLPTGHKRDRYSFADIRPGLAKLEELALAYSRIPDEQREPLHNQTLEFYQNVELYHMLLHAFDFARDGMVISPEAGIPSLPVSEALAMAPQTLAALKASRAAGQAPDPGALTFYNLVLDVARAATRGPHLFPPARAEEKEWDSGGTAMLEILQGVSGGDSPSLDDIRAVEECCAALEAGPSAFQRKFAALHERLAARSDGREDARRVGLEAFYHRMDWFFKALVLFSLGCLSSLAMWFAARRPAGGILARATLALSAAGFLICLLAIVQRIFIMGRSPIGNLYDTIIFIAMMATGLALLVELFFRRRLALGLAPFAGAALVFLSRRFEIGDAKDHLDPLVAVLSSNFWLTMHVITIAVGYAGGLLAALFSTIYILMRGLRLDGGDGELRRGLSTATYAMVSFCLFFSLLGTILGGVWANESWGRFWGWDPKENGALLIVIWTLVILHARLAGYIKEWGLHLATAFLACIVAFSWWHVNFLNVGLHNYGFTAGQSTVWTFYAGMAAIILFGVISKIIESQDAPTMHLIRGEKEHPEQPSP